MKIKRAAGEYSVYVAISFLRALLFYYISRITAPAEFIYYSSYLYYTDIFTTIVGSGTVAAFSLRGTSTNRLAPALCFEVSFVLALLVLFLIKVLMFGSSIELNLTMLCVLSFLKTINLLFSRFYLFFENIARSNINDLLGNFAWIPLIFVWRWMGGAESIDAYMAIWALTLVLGVSLNFWQCRRYLKWENPVANWKRFAVVYLQSFHFSLVNKLYGTLEKLLVISRFGINTDTSSYLMASKVTGFAAEMSGGFAQSLALNRVGKDLDDRQSETRILKRLMGLNLVLMVLVCAAVLVGSDYVYLALKSQLTQKNVSLLYWLVPAAVLSQMHGIVSIYLQRHSQFRYLMFTSLFQLLLLATLYQAPLTLYSFVGTQIVGFLLLVAADWVALRRGTK